MDQSDSSKPQQSDSSKPEPISPDEVLERVLGLEIASWSYIWEEGEVRHIGPMAQDFYGAFGVGGDDRHIHPADGQGVAFAAIQALHALVLRQADQIAELKSRMERLEGEEP